MRDFLFLFFLESKISKLKIKILDLTRRKSRQPRELKKIKKKHFKNNFILMIIRNLQSSRNQIKKIHPLLILET